MRPESAEALGSSFDSLRPMWAHEDLRPAKRYLDAATPDVPLPLDAIYLLAPRGAPEIEPSIRGVPPLDALPHLMANRHMPSVLTRAGHARDFAALSRLVERVPVREVLRPEGLHATEATVDALLADAVAA
jgi:hypothetical protein